ncbi:hypothetical protein COCC4DRAFT_80641 [Bipolaris maydis ATCC 48331]|uniref:Uncharacterized protein n=2 Tax=Cochliobolus heterostrophus TaxID=5016 RepID=M2UEZ2_COCH5|nr:uncharacterized protein COCC4DRAFT_80641 [Bipolaris maydis ATCC 48331]EMD86447.1 hypothetical protein COCHEDRAFT_1207417 [Bipolaris maydis C5]ENI06398.1 hypothetical protein COCC4DRAFT_80641 [Bipolaris maydis ATCC 48331]KAJ6214061.1 hypothetical protein PSV09DRAFT_1207417 [Bipolaris maydis]
MTIVEMGAWLTLAVDAVAAFFSIVLAVVCSAGTCRHESTMQDIDETSDSCVYRNMFYDEADGRRRSTVSPWVFVLLVSVERQGARYPGMKSVCHIDWAVPHGLMLSTSVVGSWAVKSCTTTDAMSTHILLSPFSTPDNRKPTLIMCHDD